MIRILRYFLAEALTSVRRGLGISVLAVATIAIALTILGIFLYFSGNLSAVVQSWSEDVQVQVYLQDDITPSTRHDLESRLQGMPEVDVMMFVPKDVALQRFQREFAELGGLAELLDTNPMPASFEVRLRPEHRQPEALARFASRLETMQGVEDVDYDTGWVKRLDSLVQLAGGAAVFFGTILLVAATFTTSNVIRLAMYSRRDEVEILQLVGATRGFIQGPFLVEGLLQGVAGGLLALLLLAGTHLAFAVLVPSSGNVFLRVLTSHFLGAGAAAGLVLGGGLMGLGGSLFAVRKFLADTSDIRPPV
jgi:cell division transport system permease protein